MDPKTSALLTNAREHLQQGRLPAAEAELRGIISSEPFNLHALILLAGIHIRLGRLPEAIDGLQFVLQRAPDQKDAIALMALAKRAGRDFAGAAEQFEHLVSLGERTAQVYAELGSCWLEGGDAVQAGTAFKRAIELDRGQARNYYNLGLALKLAGRSFETFETFKRAIQLDPAFHDSYVQLWEQMRQLVFWKQGLPLLEQGLHRHPDSTQMKVMLAITYGKVGDTEKAEELFKIAAAADTLACTPYAHWLQEEGRFEESVPLLKESIRHNPIQGQPYYYLATSKSFEVEGKALAVLIDELLRNKSIEADERMFLHYALAKSFDQAKNYESAMANYDLANSLAFRLFECEPYDHSAASKQEEREGLAKLYSKESIDRLSANGSKEPLPIFIVGMIRTGTTLLNQILASHAKVESAGEQPFWQVSSGRIARRWLESSGEVSDIKELESGYLEVLRQASKSAERVVDKMPTNFFHMGLMSIVFPRGKFIHIRRSPIDTCVSIYTTFLGRGTQFAYNKRNIVNYYHDYMSTMDHWRSAIPEGQMIEIDYEDLVSNSEAVIRNVLEFCELEWDEGCLRHELNPAQVSTPSLWTVRQPVNASSVERWRRYEPWLGELLELKGSMHPPPTLFPIPLFPRTQRA